MRYLFGKSFQDWTMRPPSSTPALATPEGGSVLNVVVADALRGGIASLTEGGPAETDLTDPVGTPITAPSTDGNGYLNPFMGPDEVKVLWLSFDEGTTWFQTVASQAVADAADYVPPLVVIGPADTEPPPGTPVGTLVFREVF